MRIISKDTSYPLFSSISLFIPLSLSIPLSSPLPLYPSLSLSIPLSSPLLLYPSLSLSLPSSPLPSIPLYPSLFSFSPLLLPPWLLPLSFSLFPSLLSLSLCPPFRLSSSPFLSSYPFPLLLFFLSVCLSPLFIHPSTATNASPPPPSFFSHIYTGLVPHFPSFPRNFLPFPSCSSSFPLPAFHFQSLPPLFYPLYYSLSPSVPLLVIQGFLTKGTNEWNGIE